VPCHIQAARMNTKQASTERKERMIFCVLVINIYLRAAKVT
jgi:hypothetical protein